MITQISLENFKGFRELKDLKLKPITILCGTNSSGKSSILQSLLLLRQSFESQNPVQNLLLNGRFVHLGIFDNLLFGKDESNTLKFKVTLKLNRRSLFIRDDKFSHILYIRLRELLSYNNNKTSDKDLIINFCIELEKDKKYSSDFHLNPISVKRFFIEYFTEDFEPRIIELTKFNDEIYEVEWKNIENRYRDSNIPSGKIKLKCNFSNLFPNFVLTPSKKGSEYLNSELFGVIFNLRETIKSILCSYNYLGPLREQPSRRYIYENEIVEIGNKGENSAYILLSERDNIIKDHFFFDTLSNKLYSKSTNLKEGVTEWLNYMNIKNFNPTSSNQIIYLNMYSNSSTSTEVNIADVGFGVSQIFPIVLEGLRMNAHKTLLLEQPEIHLHPNLQMQLSDFFIAMAKSNKKFIVETHSDHIINRLVRRIVEDNSAEYKNLIGIYFFKTGDDGIEYEEVKVDLNEGLINWPKDFFDQTALEQKIIMETSLKNRINNKRGGI